MIFTRSFIKEVLITTFWTTAIVLIIFISNLFIRHLGASASGRLFGAVIWKLVLIQVPYYLGLLLPLGLYLGTILTLSRLVVDHELMAWWASGVSMHFILKVCVLLGVGVAIFVGILNMWFNPFLLRQQQLLLHQARSATLLQAISPGRFVAFNYGSSVAYVAKIDPHKDTLEQVFLAVKSKNNSNDNWDVLLAKKGRITENEATRQRYLVTTDGHRYIGQPGRADYRIIQYGSYALLSQSGVTTLPKELKENSMNIVQLLERLATGTKKGKIINELLWRFSLPISAIILPILAVALSETRIRQGRYGKLLPAILLYIIYVNLLLLSRETKETSYISPWFAFGLVHCGMLLFGIGWYCHQQGLWQSIKQRYPRLKRLPLNQESNKCAN